MQLQYRPEVDGLRAVSLLVIILFHLNFPGMPGGFVAVDIFFIISGFLITSGIASDIKGEGFSFAAFYKKRVIRLAPAYILVICVSVIAAYFLMLPAELVDFLESVIYASVFIANFYFWDNVGGYFAIDSDTVPLLHLWTLAVEEQYYLAWPMVMLIISKTTKQYLLPISILLLLSVFISEWGAQHYRAAAYYMAPTRAFDLLLGALLAFIPLKTYSPYVHNFITITSLAVVCWAFVTYSEAMVFPGYNAFIVSFAVGLIVMFSHHPHDLLGKLLSTRVMVYIGKVSYPAYLWHWPIISLGNIYLVEIDFIVGALMFSATFFLSALTYSYIEKPARKFKKYRPSVVILFGCILPITMMIAFSAWGIQNKGWPQRVSPELKLKSEALLARPSEIRGRCNQGPVNKPLSSDICILGNKNEELTVLLTGDSHANHFSGFINILLRDANRRGYDITQSNTPFLPGLTNYQYQGESLIEYKNFEKRNIFIEKHIKTSNYDFVVLGGAYADFTTDGIWNPEYTDIENKNAFFNSIQKAIEIILSQSSRPVLIEGNPQHPTSLARCTLNNLRFSLKEVCHIPRSEHDAYFKEWQEFIIILKDKYPNLKVINISDLICDTQKCNTDVNNVPLYLDHGHLNYQGSELIGKLYLEKYSNPFKIVEK